MSGGRGERERDARLVLTVYPKAAAAAADMARMAVNYPDLDRCFFLSFSLSFSLRVCTLKWRLLLRQFRFSTTAFFSFWSSSSSSSSVDLLYSTTLIHTHTHRADVTAGSTLYTLLFSLFILWFSILVLILPFSCNRCRHWRRRRQRQPECSQSRQLGSNWRQCQQNQQQQQQQQPS